MSQTHTRQLRKRLRLAARKLAAGLGRLVRMQPENHASRTTKTLLRQVAQRLYRFLVRPILDFPQPQARRKLPH
ncbi:hypothetical protein SAMN06265337_0338 [Hymenobacter gelipurpurascens]|uniref:Uncharacterized protein n=1 Tax=Hymenobacter gelipurpurascens TaxID=89968 RepID=A0A212T474_9BACT|nr:hypothetical protein [Hymenobacter gelipurpurascens]SNC60815.1 hypothetical protein SAMN06265337_0338 [Hymenobacter gelipurpurascens]